MDGHRRSDISFAGPRSTAVVARVEESMAGGTRVEPEPEIDTDLLARTLRSNKLSRELLDDDERASEDASHREARERRLERETRALCEAGVSFAAIKNLKAPFAMMSDVDLLVPNAADHAVAARVLAEQDYEFYRFRLLAHPRKMMAKQSQTDPRPVDIYPDAIWIRKVVCDPASVVERAGTKPPREPAPADDLYLVATHAYSHLSVTLAELLHGVAVLDRHDLDWAHLTDRASRYGCRDALLGYLYPLDWYLRATGRDPVPDAVFDALETGLVAAAVRRWWDGLTPPVEFPLEFPLHLPTVLSAFHHVPQIARRRSIRTTYKDLQSHALTLGSKLVRGEA